MSSRRRRRGGRPGRRRLHGAAPGPGRSHGRPRRPGARGSDTLSTHALMRGGVLQLSRWGVLDDVVAAGTPAIRRTVFHYPDGEDVDVAIRPRSGVDALYAPRRHLLDRLLVEAAEEAGVQVLHETTVTSLRRDGSGRVAGVVGDPRRRPRRALRRAHHRRRRHPVPGRRAGRCQDHVAGTDGERGALPLRRGPAGRRLRVDVRRRRRLGRHPDQRRSLLPVRGHHARADAAPAPLGVERAIAELLAAAGPAAADRARGLRPVSPVRGWSGVPGFARQSWGPGWALVGDAGYFKDPITSHGITDALRDAELLAEQVLAARAGAVPEEVALARYQETRDRLSRELFEVTEGVAAYDWDADGIRTLLRRFSAAMGDEVDHLERSTGSRSSRAERRRPDHREKASTRALTGVASPRSRLGGCDARRHQPARRVLGRRRRPAVAAPRVDPAQRGDAGEAARPAAGPAAAARAGDRPAVARPAPRAGRARGCTRPRTTRGRPWGPDRGGALR